MAERTMTIHDNPHVARITAYGGVTRKRIAADLLRDGDSGRGTVGGVRADRDHGLAGVEPRTLGLKGHFGLYLAMRPAASGRPRRFCRGERVSEAPPTVIAGFARRVPRSTTGSSRALSTVLE